MTTYLGEKAVGIGSIKAEIGVTGIVLHDDTLVGNGNTEPLGVNTANIVSQQTLANTVSVLNTAIDAQADAIAKTRNDFEVADQEIRADMNEKDSELESMINDHAEELTTLRGNQASLGDQVSGIEEKIPESASGSNPLVTKQQLLDEEMDIRDDLNESVSELQTQITAQAGAIATKQDKLIAGDNITIVDNVISATGGGGSGGDYELPTASATQLGGVKVGSGLSINSNGVLSANVQEGASWGNITGDIANQTDLQNIINGIQTTQSGLQSQIDSLQAIGQFLAIWDCDTHIARYLTDGYEYQAGNYFIVGSVAGEGAVNYMPEGAMYPGFVVTTEDVKVSDMFFYDGQHWIYLANHERSIAVDADLDKESTNPVENKAVATAIEELQNRPTGVGVPQLASVDVLQVKTPEQQEERRLNYTDWMGEYSDIIVTLNLNKQDLLDKMYDLYVTISRFKTNKNLTYTVDEEEFRYRNISKFSVMNDLRQKTDIRLYCWRFVCDTQYGEYNPARYCYFYTRENYASIDDLRASEDNIGLWSNYAERAGIATCFNAIGWGNGYTANDFYIDYQVSEDYPIERYEAGDISEFANLSNSANYPEYNISDYVTKVECRKYTKDGQNYFFWCADWSNENSEVYCTADDNDLPTPNGIPVHMDELAQIYYVSNLAQFNYEFVEKRPDLNYKQVDNFDMLLEALEEMTFRGKYVDDTGRPTYWGCYWFDYPVSPVLLKDCEVRPHQQNSSWTGWKKLEDVIKEGLQNQLIDGMPIELKLPYNTYYLWMRFCSLQKRCAYGDYNNWLDEEGRSINTPMWPYQKHDLKDGVQNYNVLGRRAYARPRQAYRTNGESSKISEYILFNVCTPMDVASGSKSKATPIQKKLNIDMKAKTGLRD